MLRTALHARLAFFGACDNVAQANQPGRLRGRALRVHVLRTVQPTRIGGTCRRRRSRLARRELGRPVASLDDNVRKLLRIAQPSERVDRELKLLARRRRLLADLSGRDLNVLLLDGRDHVHATQTESRHFVGIEPGSQTIIALSDVGNARDAFESPQFVLDVNGRVVAQEQVVVAPVGGDQVDDHQRVGRHLLDGDALVLNQGRDHRQGERHTVLNQNLSHVRVDAAIKGHGQIVRAIVGAARRHVHHAFDAADLFLDRSGNRVANSQRVGAGIQRRDLDGGRRHVRILGHGKRKQRHESRQNDDDGNDRGKNRSIDEETCKHGKISPERWHPLPYGRGSSEWSANPFDLPLIR